MANPDIIEFAKRVATISNNYEKTNTELKKDYIRCCIEVVDMIMKGIPGYKGSFGTGYPFYALGENFSGTLPVIQEQLSYNSKLIGEAYSSILSSWVCAGCLERNSEYMKDLKVHCKPCPRIEDELKPRKVINRLPDLDLWMVVDDEKYAEAQEMLSTRLGNAGIYPSDVDVLGTIDKIEKISEELKNGHIPTNILPVDIHIVRYSTLMNLIQTAPEAMIEDFENCVKPYLPIRPVSWRKKWQHDDEAYNFAFDFLCSLTPITFDDEMLGTLIESRNRLADAFTTDELIDILESIMIDSVKRRFETKPLQRIYEKKVEGWKRK